MPHDIIQEGENKDFRDQLLKETLKAEMHKRYFNPFFVTSMIFFSILIAFVAMLMLIILVFLKQGFSGIGTLLG
jgi:lipopolysaccharide export LptBFGC system permease protein LptF